MNDSPDQRAGWPRGWWQRLRQGLARSSASIGGAIADLVTKRKLDSATIEELEEVLIRADLGVAGRDVLVEHVPPRRVEELGEQLVGPEAVGVAGFDPTAPRSQSGCATNLRHTPWRAECRHEGLPVPCPGTLGCTRV